MVYPHPHVTFVLFLLISAETHAHRGLGKADTTDILYPSSDCILGHLLGQEQAGILIFFSSLRMQRRRE